MLRIILCVTSLAALAPATEALAQIKPMSSGKVSHNAPQMRRHGSGLYRPNKPHSHRFHVHHHHHHYLHPFFN